MLIRVALPKGRLLGETANLLQKAGWKLSGYNATERYYRLKSLRFPNLLVKMLHERDIPIQVAVGNYDMGICGLGWVEELLARYPRSAVVKVKNLGYGEGTLYLVAGRSRGITTEEKLKIRSGKIRIASEYPNLAESFALHLRLKRFSIFPLWGAAEVYPPESADLALISGRKEADCYRYGLVPVSNVLPVSAFLIANKTSWETKDMSEILSSIPDAFIPSSPASSEAVIDSGARRTQPIMGIDKNTVCLALPDGHQQLPTLRLLNKAGIKIDDYPSVTDNRRPTTNLDRVTIKVIRPQDMPLQVANGNFDLAITGKDWLVDHQCQFPDSPVTELLNLKFGRVRIVAVISRDLAATDTYSLRHLEANRSTPWRVASEYVNIADQYARDNHLGMYRIIPTWGATEAFVPEDADVLIENTETGRTLARHGLKIMDTLLESTARLIGNTNSLANPGKRERIRLITETLRSAVAEG